MDERLHPLILGEILDRTAQMYSAQFLRFLGMSLVPMVVLLAFGAVALSIILGFVTLAEQSGGAGRLTNAEAIVLISGLVALGLVAVPVSLGALALNWAALTGASARMFQGGRFTIRSAYGSVWTRRWQLLWLMTMSALFVIVIPALLVVAITGSGASGSALASKAGMASLGWAISTAALVLNALIGGVAVWLLLRLCLGFAVCVMEQAGAWQALKRSAVLSKGTRGRIIVLFLVGYALESGLAIGIVTVLLTVIGLVPWLKGAKYTDVVSTALGLGFYGIVFLIQAVVRPVYAIGLTLFYFDQRIRKEGLDIEWLMQEAGMASAALPTEGPAAGAEGLPGQKLQVETAEEAGS